MRDCGRVILGNRELGTVEVGLVKGTRNETVVWEFLCRTRVWEFTFGILGKGNWDRGLVNLGMCVFRG